LNCIVSTYLIIQGLIVNIQASSIQLAGQRDKTNGTKVSVLILGNFDATQYSSSPPDAEFGFYGQEGDSLANEWVGNSWVGKYRVADKTTLLRKRGGRACYLFQRSTYFFHKVLRAAAASFSWRK